MDLIDLQTFALAVQESSLSAAARRLNISQPAASSRLRKLEQHLGETLLTRTGRGVEPTAAGRRLFDRIVPVLRELEQIDQELSSDGDLRGRIAVGSTDLVAVHHLPNVLRRLRAEHPRLELTMHVEGTRSLLDLLDRGRAELVLGTLPVDDGRYEQQALFRDPLVIVAPKGHEQSGKRSVAPARLAGEPWILHKSTSLTRRQVESFFRERELALHIETEISSPEAIKELVRAGLGLSVLPRVSVAEELREGKLSEVAIRGFKQVRHSGLIYPKNTTLSRPARSLAALLEEESKA